MNILINPLDYFNQDEKEKINNILEELNTSLEEIFSSNNINIALTGAFSQSGACVKTKNEFILFLPGEVFYGSIIGKNIKIALHELVHVWQHSNRSLSFKFKTTIGNLIYKIYKCEFTYKIYRRSPGELEANYFANKIYNF